MLESKPEKVLFSTLYIQAYNTMKATKHGPPDHKAILDYLALQLAYGYDKE